MRTKFILFVWVFMADVVLSSAQTNIDNLPIVGYATVTFPSGLSLVANPLSNGFTNGANEIGLLIDGERILTWNGIGFDTYAYDLTSNTWSDDALHPTNAPSLPPGKGFFFFNPGPSTNITFEGLITPSPGQSNSIALPPGYSLVGSMLPATVTNITSSPINLPIIDGMIILTWSVPITYIPASIQASAAGLTPIFPQLHLPPIPSARASSSSTPAPRLSGFSPCHDTVTTLVCRIVDFSRPAIQQPRRTAYTLRPQSSFKLRIEN